MKKVLSMAMVALILVVSLAGCGSSASSATSIASSANSSGEMEPTSYTIMLNSGVSEYPPDGGEAKQIILENWEKKLGITNTDYNVVLVSGSDYSTKLNAMLAGGDIPDLFTANISDLESLVSSGLIAPIDEYVENMPNYKKLMEVPGNQEMYDAFMIDGKHYGFPRFSMPGEANGPGINGLIMRTDWLKNVDKETPTTLDELHDVLQAFTYDDPDGNGQNDTYGLGSSKTNYFSSIFGAYGVYLAGINSWTIVDGKVVHSTTLPEVKDVLTVLSQWYSEGLIDPDSFVLEDKQTKEKFIAENIGSFEQTIWSANDAREAWKTSNPEADCCVIAPPKGPDGLSGYPVSPIPSTAMVLSQNCVDNNDANRFIKILDWDVDDSDEGGHRLLAFGVEGEHYTYDRENDVIVSEIVGTATNNLYSMGFSDPVLWLSLVDRRWIAHDDPRYYDLEVTNNSDTWLSTAFSGSVPAMKDYPDLYTKLWSEYFTKIVTGALPVSAFDEYVEKFYEQGGAELTEQVNAAYNP